MRTEEEVENELKKLMVLYASPVTQAYRGHILVQIQFGQWVLGKEKNVDTKGTKKDTK